MGRMNKAAIGQIVQWLAAACVAALLINGLTFFYYRPTGWIYRSNGATEAIWRPGSTVVYGLEGYGINKTDSNGYMNPAIPAGGGTFFVLDPPIHRQMSCPGMRDTVPV